MPRGAALCVLCVHTSSPVSHTKNIHSVTLSLTYIELWDVAMSGHELVVLDLQESVMYNNMNLIACSSDVAM